MVLTNPNTYQQGKTLVFFVRHGEQLRDKEYNSKIETPCLGLTPLGKKQAEEIAKKFSAIKSEIDGVYSSDVSRALQTAEPIAKCLHKKLIIRKELAEFKKIVWTKKIYHLQYWKHYLKHRNSIKVFNELLEKNQGKVLVMVAHANIIKGLIGKKLGLPLKDRGKLNHDNCHVTLARFAGKKLDYLYYFNNKELTIPKEM
ncbi:MAG: histidine phosphatase family protein [Candidatus Nanoarchaeia archaeon]